LLRNSQENLADTEAVWRLLRLTRPPTGPTEVIAVSDSQDLDSDDTVESVQSPSGRGATSSTLPEEHQPDVQGNIDWDEYSQYWCVICRDNCINKTRSVYARAKECRHCFVVPTADRHSVDDLDER